MRAGAGTRRRRVGSALAVVVVLVAAGVLVGSAVRDGRAQQALTDALVTSRVPGREQEAKRRFELLIQDYAGSSAAWAAHDHLAVLEAADGGFDEARSLWQRLAEGGPDELAAEAEMNLIYLDREEGRLDELADRLEGLVESGESHLPEAVLLFELAETLERLGRGEEARRIRRFEEVVPEKPRVQR